jgi:hypothetical protein
MTMLIFVMLASLVSPQGEPPEHGGVLNPSMSPPDYVDVVCSQPFVYANMDNGLGFSSNNSWMIADDFTPVAQANINCFEIWAIYASGNPSSILVQFRSDSSGPGTVLDDYTTTELSHENTGLSSWGYPLWYTVISPGITFTASQGTKYWLCLQTTSGGTSYWLCALQMWADMSYFSQNNGSTWASSQSTWGTAYEQFMIISDIVSLERDTWGGIKAMF